MSRVDKVIEAIQNKKGKHITLIDMHLLENKPSNWFVICEGNSNIQVNAITDEIEKVLRENYKEKPLSITGKDNTEWIVIDYSDIVIHIFIPAMRAYYNLEALWYDGVITEIDDIQ